MPIDWSVRKAVAFESDDWGNCAWAPEVETYERMRAQPAVDKYWSSPASRTGSRAPWKRPTTCSACSTS